MHVCAHTCCVCVHTCCVHSQSYRTLWDTMDYSPPGSFVHGISQVRILEWVAISCSRRSSQLKNWTQVSWSSCVGGCILCHLHHLGSPYTYMHTYICMCVCVCISFQSFPLLDIRNTEYISLCHMVRPCCFVYFIYVSMLSHFNRVWRFVTSWTVYIVVCIC